MSDTSVIRAGLIGRGIARSESPAIHGREAARQGIALNYELIDFDALGLPDEALADKLGELADAGFAGVNITHPFKQAVIPLLDEVDETALALGAVNCVSLQNGRKTGSNSDWIGFSFLMQHELPGVALGRVALLGAGGAGSATGYALARMGSGELAVFDADQSRAQALAERLTSCCPNMDVICCTSAEEALAGADGVVQATPIGMTAHPGMPIAPEMLAQGQWLADIIYFPRLTPLVVEARSRGLRAAGGAAMAVGQAALPFRMFTGAEPDLDKMLAAFDEADASRDGRDAA